MIRGACLTSGSCGNCYLFHDGRGAVLVDDGLTVTGLRRRLDDLNIPLSDITDLFITHAHPDHVKGAGALRRASGIRVHVSREGYEGEAKVYQRLGLGPGDVELFDFTSPISAGTFEVTPFRTSHDSAGSAGFLVRSGEEASLVLTDTGFWPEEAARMAASCGALYVESNYDDGMLDSGRYPLFLKRRIKGERGHMSNAQARAFLEEVGVKDKKIYLVHLSENNNTPALAAAAMEGLECASLTVCERGAAYTGDFQ